MATIEYKFSTINERRGGVDVVINGYAGTVGVEPDTIPGPDGQPVANPSAGAPTFTRSSRTVTRTRTVPTGTTRAQIETAIRDYLAANYPQHELVPWQA